MIYDVMLDASSRLFNILLRYCVENKGDFKTWQEFAETTPAATVRIYKLSEMRNCGDGTIAEFINLRNATA